MALTSHTQEPATSSRASAKGPSITVRLAPSKAILLPADEGFSPSPSIITPAFTNSSLNAPIASNISVISAVGGRPFSLSSVAFTNTITRIGHLLHHQGPAWPRSEEHTYALQSLMRISYADFCL